MTEDRITAEDIALHERAMALAFQFRRVETELNEVIDRLYEGRGTDDQFIPGFDHRDERSADQSTWPGPSQPAGD